MAKKQISLLSDASFDLTIQGRIVSWLTTWGRAILVLVEVVVIGAFFSRFWLDRKNSDLSDNIRQKRAILESTLEFENEFRSLQKRFVEADAVLAKEEDLFFPMTIISRSLPSGIILKSFSFSQKEEGSTATLIISVFSERSLSSFISQLLRDEKVDSVRIGSIKKEKIATGIEIGIAINFKADENK